MQVIEFFLQIGLTFSAGLYIALSPCLFPLLPLFLLRTLQTENSRIRSLMVTMTLVFGILTSLALFILILQFIIGMFIITHFTQIQAILGIILVFLGVLLIFETLRIKIGLESLNFQSHQENPKGLLGVYMIGLTYSLIAAPCTGPAIFGLIGVLGAETNTLMFLVLFLILALGVSLPYLVLAVLSGEARLRYTSKMTHQVKHIEKIVGLLLIIIGIVLILPLFGITLLY